MDYNEQQYQKYFISCYMKGTTIENHSKGLSLEELYDWCKSFTEDYGLMQYYKENKEK